MKFCILVALIACCLVAPVQLGSPCPDAVTILPCKCTKSGPDTLMNCLFHDTGLLKLAFDAISDERAIVDYFNVSSTRMSYVGESFFENATVRSAAFYTDRWSSISKDAFVGQEKSLTMLAIHQSLLTSVPVESIGILIALEYFAIVHSEITYIKAGAFGQFKSANVLKTLDLRNNYIKNIGVGAFKELKALEVLYLSENKLTELQSGVLPATSSIRILDILNNRLETIPEDIKSLSKEAVINLGHNNIDTISGIEIRYIITKKFFVSILDNPLKCTCALKMLTLSADPRIVGTCTQSTTGQKKLLSELKASDFQDCFLFNFVSNLFNQKH